MFPEVWGGVRLFWEWEGTPGSEGSEGTIQLCTAVCVCVCVLWWGSGQAGSFPQKARAWPHKPPSLGDLIGQPCVWYPPF